MQNLITMKAMILLSADILKPHSNYIQLLILASKIKILTILMYLVMFDALIRAPSARNTFIANI